VSPPPDDRTERLLGTTLRIGMALAAAVVLVGVLVLLATRGQVATDDRVFRGEPSELRGVAGIWRAARHLRPRGLIQLGLLILIATPIARVVFAAIAFARQRDWLYTAVASIVLTALLFGLL